MPGATDCDGEKKVAKEKCGNRKRRYKGKVTHRICRGEKGKRPKKREQVSEREREREKNSLEMTVPSVTQTKHGTNAQNYIHTIKSQTHKETHTLAHAHYHIYTE